MNDLRAILLDMDGTLVDAFPPIVHALNTTLREFGHAEMSELEVRRHTGQGNIGIPELFGAQHAEQARHRFLELHDAEYLRLISPMPGAESLLQWLHEQGLGTAVVTSKGQQRAEAQIELLGWNRYLPVIIGKQDGLPGKPHPEPVLRACQALKVPPETAIMVGDGIADMTAAMAAGSRGLGLAGSFSPEELAEAGATDSFSTLNEVMQWLQMQIR
jgi:HAD superfamily hydrolase (TIGR01509 family)